MNPSFYVGWSGVVVGGCSSIPQLIKTIRTKSVEDLSPLFVYMRIASEFLYATYGYMTNDYVMIASTGLPLISDIVQLKLYYRYKTSDNPSVEMM